LTADKYDEGKHYNVIETRGKIGGGGAGSFKKWHGKRGY